MKINFKKYCLFGALRNSIRYFCLNTHRPHVWEYRPYILFLSRHQVLGCRVPRVCAVAGAGGSRGLWSGQQAACDADFSFPVSFLSLGDRDGVVFSNPWSQSPR